MENKVEDISEPFSDETDEEHVSWLQHHINTKKCFGAVTSTTYGSLIVVLAFLLPPLLLLGVKLEAVRYEGALESEFITKHSWEVTGFQSATTEASKLKCIASCEKTANCIAGNYNSGADYQNCRKLVGVTAALLHFKKKMDDRKSFFLRKSALKPGHQESDDNFYYASSEAMLYCSAMEYCKRHETYSPAVIAEEDVEQIYGAVLEKLYKENNMNDTVERKVLIHLVLNDEGTEDATEWLTVPAAAENGMEIPARIAYFNTKDSSLYPVTSLTSAQKFYTVCQSSAFNTEKAPRLRVQNLTNDSGKENEPNSKV